MKKHLHFKRGFTLVELMVSVAISVIIVAGLFTIFRAGSNQAQFSQAKMTLQESVREALFKMAQEIRHSDPDSIVIGETGNSLTLPVPDPDFPVENLSYNINWDGAHTIQYSLAEGQLIRTDQDTNQVAVLANDITSVNFTEYNDAAGEDTEINAINITLSAQRTLIDGRNVPEEPLQMTTQAQVRNT